MKKTLIGLAIAVAVTGITTSAHAASPACGTSCMTLTSEAYGPGYAASVPNRRILFRAPSVDLAPSGPYESEDFESRYLGPVSVLYHYGIVSALVEFHWGNDAAYEYVYAPGSDESSLCLGISSIADEGMPVTLQQCGVTAKTVWISVPNSTSRVFTTLISGTDTSVTSPYVLTAGSDNGQLAVDHLVVSLGKIPAEGQMWRAMYGVIS
jgi:hypothetical protein